MPRVVIVGLGTAGLVAAHVLARAGITVIALQPSTTTGRRAAIAAAPPSLRIRADEEATLQPDPPAGLDAVGGAKRLAAAQAYRLDAWTLRARTMSGRGRIPSDADVIDWPLDPHELEEWYGIAESAFGVAIRPTTTWTRRMHEAAVQLGWDPFWAPAAADADSSFLLDAHDVRVIDGTAVEILRDSAGSVRGVAYLDSEGAHGRLRADAVVVASGVVPTVRLLLLSDITGDDTVGRWFMAHNSFVVSGDFTGTDLHRDEAGPASAVAVAAFEGGSLAGRDLGFEGGSIIQAAMTGPWSAHRAAAISQGLDADPDVAAAWVRENHRSIGSVWAQPDQMPRRENRIDLDPIHRDRAGFPVARLTFALGEDDTARWDFLSHRMMHWLESAGARRTWRTPLTPQPLGTHLYGGARMGTDHRTSTVDGFGRLHQTPGLVVVGSSTFPSTGGRGPVLTIEALAWRAAARLASDLR